MTTTRAQYAAAVAESVDPVAAALRQPKPSVFDDPDCYPGLTLVQPYGGAVLLSAQGYDAKDIETRKVQIKRLNVDIVICIGLDVWDAHVNRVYRELTAYRGIPTGKVDASFGLHGVAVALAQITMCRLLTAEDYHRSLWWDAEENAKKSRWAWVLGSMRPIKPFRWRGSQGWSRVPRGMVEVIGG